MRQEISRRAALAGPLVTAPATAIAADHHHCIAWAESGDTGSQQRRQSNRAQ